MSYQDGNSLFKVLSGGNVHPGNIHSLNKTLRFITQTNGYFDTKYALLIEGFLFFFLVGEGGSHTLINHLVEKKALNKVLVTSCKRNSQVENHYKLNAREHLCRCNKVKRQKQKGTLETIYL